MIVVFGSLNMDIIVRVPHLPEPGETVLAPEHRTAPGGKGANQAVAAARAGARVAMAGCVGADDNGRDLAAVIGREGVDTGLISVGGKPTALAMIPVDGAGANQIVVSSGANGEARQDRVTDDVLGAASTLLLQHEVPRAENIALARRARAAGLRVILNAAPAAPVVPETLDLLVVNEVEAGVVGGALGIPSGDPLDLAQALADGAGLATVVTLGERGCIAVAPGERWRVAGLAVRAIDSVGAGDAFCGTLAAALDAGLALVDALRRATVAGALACLEPGAMPALPHAASVDARLAELAPPVPL